MRTLSLPLLPLPLLAFPTQIQNQIHFSNSISTLHGKTLPILNSAKILDKTIVYGINPTDSSESVFYDEDGVVDDMEGYLNHLSLEYDSVWDTKPAWLASPLLFCDLTVVASFNLPFWFSCCLIIWY